MHQAPCCHSHTLKVTQSSNLSGIFTLLYWWETEAQKGSVMCPGHRARKMERVEALSSTCPLSAIPLCRKDFRIICASRGTALNTRINTKGGMTPAPTPTSVILPTVGLHAHYSTNQPASGTSLVIEQCSSRPWEKNTGIWIRGGGGGVSLSSWERTVLGWGLESGPPEFQCQH